MERILSSLRGISFLHLIAGWFAGGIAVALFGRYDHAATIALFSSVGYAVLFCLLLLGATLLFVAERRLPFGGYTMLMAAHAIVLTMVFGQAIMLVAPLAVGLFLDMMYARMQTRHAAWQVKTRVFAAAGAFVVSAGHLVAIAYIYNLSMATWPVAGAVILATGLGLLLGCITTACLHTSATG